MLILCLHKFAIIESCSMSKVRPLPQGRAQLVQVLTISGDVIHTDDVTKALSLSRLEASKRLSRWAEQGWVSRVGKGVYVPASLDTLGSERILDDGWVLVPALFEPAYIAGRSAAEHWDLTEQIFKDIVVITAQVIRNKTQERQGFKFTVKHSNAAKIFGTKAVWRHHTKVMVSDVHRTIVDMLDDPAIGGGIQQVSDCVEAYLRRSDRDDQKLIEFAERLANGAVFKRLGFLAGRHSSGVSLSEICRSHLTKGNAKLDPALSCNKLVPQWRLCIPQLWMHGGRE